MSFTYDERIKAIGEVTDAAMKMDDKKLALVRDFCLYITTEPQATEPEPAPYAGPWVYLIQAGPSGPIKIGFSKDPEARLKQLSAPQGPPLHIRRLFEGGRELEKALHEHFAMWRLHGEWFDVCDQSTLPLVVKGDLDLVDVLDPEVVAELGLGQ